jgi:hypothetical protein
MNVEVCSGFFLSMEEGDISNIRTFNINILGDGDRSVLSHSMETLLNYSETI